MDWKKALGSIAPIIGTALGGPFGGLAGSVLGSVLGVDDPTSEDALAEATKKALADPNKVMQLKEAEMAFKAKMKELDIKEQDLHAKDRQSARSMLVSTKSWMPGLISTFFISGWAGLNYVVFNAEAALPNADVIMRVLGTSDAALMLILSFWFGSSSGSQAKNDIIRNQR